MVSAVLTKTHRVRSGADFKTTVRRGRRVTSDHAVIYVVGDSTVGESLSPPTRFGFIVSKAVGGAVVRNLMRRRLRSAARELLATCDRGNTVVVRMLPGSAALSWGALSFEISAAVAKAVGAR